MNKHNPNIGYCILKFVVVSVKNGVTVACIRL